MVETYVETYRNCKIYHYGAGDVVSEAVFWTPCVVGYWLTLKACKNHIDESKVEPPPVVPEEVLKETYKGVDIYWVPSITAFRAQVATGYVALGASLEECKSEIDKILAYLTPPPPGTWPWPMTGVQSWFEELWNNVVSTPSVALNSFWTTHIMPKLDWVKDRLQESVDWVYNQLKPIVSGIATAVSNTWTSISTSIGNMWTALETGISDIGSWIWSKINPVLTAISKKVTDTWDDISKSVGGVITNITGALTGVKDMILGKVTETAGNIISNIGTSLSNIAADLWTAISTGLNNIGTLITTSVSGLWDSLTGLAGDLLSGMATKLGEALSGFWDWMLKSLGNTAEMIFGAVDFVISKVRSGIMVLLGSFLDVLTNAMSPGSPPKEIMIASNVLTQTSWQNQIKMIDAAYQSSPTSEGIQQSAVDIQSALVVAATVAMGVGLAADIAHPLKNIGFRPTVREMVYWSGIPAVTAAIATTPTAIGLLTPLRYALMERWTPMIPPEGDLVRFRVREVWHPELRPSLLVGPETPEYYAAMAKQGYSNYWADSYWAAHWVLPSISQLNEMLYRNVIEHQEWVNFVTYNDYIPAMIPKLEKIIYQPYTRVDVRRMWDIGLVTDAEMLENYKWLGYDEVHAQRMTLWTKAYVIAGDVRALYSKGWIDENGAREMLINVGIPEERLDVFMKRLVKLEQTERMADERDLTKTDILRMFKINIFTENEAMSFLQDLGYDEDEAYYLLQVQKYQPEIELKELTMANILKAYRYEIYNRGQAKLDLMEAGWSEQAAEIMLKLEDVKLKDSQIEKARERDLTPTQIIAGIKKELIDANTGYLYLQYLGYSDWEIQLMFALEGIE